MNSKSNSNASALLVESFGKDFSKFESLSNDLESELTIEEKRLRGMPATSMFLTMFRKIEVVPHHVNRHGHVLRERWLLHAAQVDPTSEPIDFEIEDQLVTDALAIGDSPIVAALIARPDIVTELRARFSTFNAVCQQFELAQISVGSSALKEKSGPRM